MSCRESIGIPFIGFLICSIFKATFVCNIVQCKLYFMVDHMYKFYSD